MEAWRPACGRIRALKGSSDGMASCWGRAVPKLAHARSTAGTPPAADVRLSSVYWDTAALCTLLASGSLAVAPISIMLHTYAADTRLAALLAARPAAQHPQRIRCCLSTWAAEAGARWRAQQRWK